MGCIECGGSVDVYRLAERTATVCERCGRVGIDADHRGSAEKKESWDVALRRFYQLQSQSSAEAASASSGSDDDD